MHFWNIFAAWFVGVATAFSVMTGGTSVSNHQVQSTTTAPVEVQAVSKKPVVIKPVVKEVEKTEQNIATSTSKDFVICGRVSSQVGSTTDSQQFQIQIRPDCLPNDVNGSPVVSVPAQLHIPALNLDEAQFLVFHTNYDPINNWYTVSRVGVAYIDY